MLLVYAGLSGKVSNNLLKKLGGKSSRKDDELRSLYLFITHGLNLADCSKGKLVTIGTGT